MTKHFEIGEEVVTIEEYGYIRPNDVGIFLDTFF